MLTQIEPLLVMLKALGEQTKVADKRPAEITEADTVVRRLCSVPGVGLVVATAFASTLEDASRLLGAKHVCSYLGLVPRERSSGEKQRRGHVWKAGPPRVRYVLVEAAWVILRRRDPATAGLHDWATKIRERRGACVAAAAL